MEWGGPESMNPIVDWTLIDGADTAKAFADAVLAAPRRAFGWNSISNAIAFCHQWIEGNAFDGFRKVIDVSGDAGQRGGMPLPLARELAVRSEEHTSELQSLMRISYAVFCLKKKKTTTITTIIYVNILRQTIVAYQADGKV